MSLTLSRQDAKSDLMGFENPVRSWPRYPAYTDSGVEWLVAETLRQRVYQQIRAT